MVKGDLFPQVVTATASSLAVPLTDLYNAMTVTKEWPATWKSEHVTVIPKNSHPETVNDARNISCTLLFSKVYESFLLGWLMEKVGTTTNQIGGVKGCSTEHYLVLVWQKILENLEDKRAASLLTTIDYSKAFNRLNYQKCLEALRKKGATRELLEMVAAFLTGRKMTVKVGKEKSSLRDLFGGAPQGSILGVFLFNCTIDDFEAPSTDVEPYLINGGTHHGQVRPYDPLPEVEGLVEVPLEDQNEAAHLIRWIVEKLQVVKYFGDNSVHEKINMENAEPIPGTNIKKKHSPRTQNLVRTVVHVAEDSSMQINAKKTKMLCISDAASCTASAYTIDHNEGEIHSKSTLKVLGLTFSAKPSMQAQVDAIVQKIT